MQHVGHLSSPSLSIDWPHNVVSIVSAPDDVAVVVAGTPDDVAVIVAGAPHDVAVVIAGAPDDIGVVICGTPDDVTVVICGAPHDVVAVRTAAIRTPDQLATSATLGGPAAAADVDNARAPHDVPVVIAGTPN